MNLHDVMLAAQLAKNDNDAGIKAEIAEVNLALSNKVDKVSGKGLSTNDFTTDEKAKLSSLENYDAEVKADVASALNVVAINKATLGYQRKNLLMNNCKTKTTNGVTATVNGDGSITLSGVSSKTTDFLIFVNMSTGVETTDQYANNRKFLPNGKYIVSGGATNCLIQVTVSTDNASANNLVASSGGDVAFTVTDNHKYVWFRLLIKANADFSEPVTVYPMVRPAYIDDDTYEPYRPSVEEYIASLEERIAALESMNLTANSLNSSLNTAEISTTEEEFDND